MNNPEVPFGLELMAERLLRCQILLINSTIGMISGPARDSDGLDPSLKPD